MTSTMCPSCGAPNNWRELIRAPWERQAVAEGWKRQRTPMFSAETVNYALQAGATYKKQRPIRPAELDSDVRVPLMQSVITGLAGGMAVGSIARLRGADMSLWWGAAGGATVWSISWIVLLCTTRRLLWEVERLVGREPEKVNGGRKREKRGPIEVEVHERDARSRLRRVRYVKLPPAITDDDIYRVAVAILEDGVAFSRRELENVLSDDKYRALYRPMLDGGLLHYSNGRNASNGVDLTGAGRAFLRQFLVVVGGGGE